jgi:hypothetical protein
MDSVSNTNNSLGLHKNITAKLKQVIRLDTFPYKISVLKAAYNTFVKNIPTSAHDICNNDARSLRAMS